MAEMELAMIVGTVVRGWEWLGMEPGELKTREGFLRKPLGCKVAMRRRGHNVEG